MIVNKRCQSTTRIWIRVNVRFVTYPLEVELAFRSRPVGCRCWQRVASTTLPESGRWRSWFCVCSWCPCTDLQSLPEREVFPSLYTRRVYHLIHNQATPSLTQVLGYPWYSGNRTSLIPGASMVGGIRGSSVCSLSAVSLQAWSRRSSVYLFILSYE